MNRLSPVLIFTALALTGHLHGQEAKPARDPFLAPPEEILALIPDDTGGVAQVSLQLDWISLPHADANRLIRQELKSSQDATALRKAVDGMIAAKKATLLDINTLIVRGGQRSKLETIGEKPYPTEFDPPGIPQSFGTSTGPAFPTNPTTPNIFTFRNIGHTVEVEATVGEDRATIDLNLAPEWIEHLADIIWSPDTRECQQPVFHHCKMSGQLLARSGVWQLAGLFTPPSWPVKDTPAELMPLPDHRVMLFIRATVHGAENAAPADSSVKQCGLLAEWIELDQQILSVLLNANQPAGKADALRAALQPHLADGSAKLIETTFLQCRGGQRSKIESGREYPYPTEFDPPAIIPDTDSESPAPSSTAAIARNLRLTNATPNSFTVRNLGVTMEYECTVGESGVTIDLNIAPEFVTFTGLDSFGRGASTVLQPRFHTMKQTAQLLVRAGQTVLYGTFDPPPAPEAAPRTTARPPVKMDRRVVLFVRPVL